MNKGDFLWGWDVSSQGNIWGPRKQKQVENRQVEHRHRWQIGGGTHVKGVSEQPQGNLLFWLRMKSWAYLGKESKLDHSPVF